MAAPAPIALHVLFFAGEDNMKCAPVMKKIYRAMSAVQATDNPSTFWNAVVENRKLDLLIIGTHGANASFLLIDGKEENQTCCDVSYSGQQNAMTPHEFGKNLAPYLNPGCKIAIIGCSVAGGGKGHGFIQDIAATSGAEVWAADQEVRVSTAEGAGSALTITSTGGTVWASDRGQVPRNMSTNARGTDTGRFEWRR